jgi:hypothetical protein
MAVCLLASIGLDGDDVVYLGPDGARWRLPLYDVRLIGVFAAPDAGEGPAFAFVSDPDAGWFQASCNAVGADRLLAELSARLGSSVREAPASPVSHQGRVLWPPHCAGDALFEIPTDARGTAAPHLRAELRASMIKDVIKRR